MSVRRSRTPASSGRLRRTLAGAMVAGLSVTALSACDAGDAAPSASPSSGPAGDSDDRVPFRVKSNVAGQKVVPVDRTVRLSAAGGSLRSVTVSSEAGELSGRLEGAGSSWTATALPEPGVAYRVHAVAERADGKRVVRDSTFRTQALTLDEQTYASVAPLQGETVGVGMPVIVTFDVPVTDKVSIEKHMTVDSAPRQVGSWHWLSDTEAHWRPKSYWQAGTEVSVDLDINSVPAGAGVYGQESRTVDFTVGDANIIKVDAQSHQMRVFRNGELLRTLPITTGKPGFTTRSGVKVIIEKFREKRMNSETVGIDRDNPEYYDIDDVEYAMRVTYSGEFIHAAPWSVGSQGSANVSHGCTGMSTTDAGWLYDMTKRGDVG